MYSIKAAAAGIILIITHPEKTDSSGMIRQMMQLLRSEREREREREARNAGAKKVAKLTPEAEGRMYYSTWSLKKAYPRLRELTLISGRRNHST